MDLIPPHRKRDACYRAPTVTYVGVSEELLDDDAFVSAWLHEYVNDPDPNPVLGSRWPYLAVGPIRTFYMDRLAATLVVRREWIQPAW